MENKNLTLEEIVQTESWKIFMKKMEFYGSILYIISILMFVFFPNAPFHHLITTLAFSTLSIICFFMAFIKFDSESKFLSGFFNKIYGIGLAIGFTSIMFLLQNWPFPKDQMTIISIIMILISLLLGLRESSGENKNKIDWKYYTRLFMALIPLTYMLIIHKI